jgi:hypothetical protein
MWCHSSHNDVPVVYGALGDSVDLTMDVILMLCVIVSLNMCVGCECVRMGGFAYGGFCVRWVTLSYTIAVPS